MYILNSNQSEKIKQLNASWIIPTYYKNHQETADKNSYDSVKYHYFCSECGSLEEEMRQYYDDFTFGCYYYACSNCLNNNFLHPDQKTPIDKFNYKYQYKETSVQYQALAIRYMPTLIDDEVFLSSFIDFEIKFDKTSNKINFYEHTFFKQHFFADTKKRYMQKIGDFLASNIIDTIKDRTLQMKINLYPYFKNNKLSTVQKYFQNRDMKELELFLVEGDDITAYKDVSSYLQHVANNREEKSIKNAIYKSFKDSITKSSIKEQMNSTYRYNYLADYIICRAFNDVNVIVRLLDIKVDIFGSHRAEVYIDFFIWLQKRYTQKQVMQLLLPRNNKPRMVEGVIDWEQYHLFKYMPRDIFNLVYDINNKSSKLLDENFQKVKCNVSSIHDELSRINNLNLNQEQKQVVFVYTENAFEMEKNIEHLRFTLPEDSYQRSTPDEFSADVVIVNQKIYNAQDAEIMQYAVSLKYDRSTLAPIVVAKGLNVIAVEIEKRAEENNIPIFHNTQFAKILHIEAEIGQLIPENLYAAVAEAMAYASRMTQDNTQLYKSITNDEGGK
ncbi:MAG: EscU/YscU/HrcU family type III secretion system export apparatus switch protein [Sulfurimonas sp.]|jgi:type III secretion system FlhB-like substrate exporter